MTANLLMSPGLFSVFRPILVMLKFLRVSVRPPISDSSKPFTKLLGAVLSTFTFRITVTFIFHSFLVLWQRPSSCHIFSFPLTFTLWAIEMAKSTIRQVLFFRLLLLLLFTPLEFFTSVLADGFSLEFK